MKSVILFLIFILLLSLLIFLSSKVIAVSFLEFKLEKISCADEKKLQKEINLIGKNLIMIDEKSVEETLKKKFSCIKQVFLNKSLPNKIKVHVIGRQPVATIVASNSAKLVDNEGVALGGGDLPNLPKIYSENIDSKEVKNTILIINKLISFNFEIKKSSILPKKDLLIEGEYKIYFNLEKNLDIQLASLQLILNQAKIESNKVEYIDLRFRDPVIKEKS